MASSEEVSFISEWECDEENEEENREWSGIVSGEGEEADRSLSRNGRASNSCDKLRGRRQLSPAVYYIERCPRLQRFIN